jgi:serpin B
MRIHPALLGALALLVHCTGTDTGNPALPVGFELVRSMLGRDPNPQVEPAALEQLGADNRDFAFALYAQVANGNQDNLFFSPYSVSEAVAMLYAGARGQTESEIAAALRFGLPQAQLHPAFNATDQTLAKRADEVSPRAPDGLLQDPPKPGDGLRLSLVNAAFVQRGLAFQAPYLDTLATSYGAGLYTTDFGRDPAAAEARINDWFAEQTERRIEALLAPGSLNAATRLVLANAIYFKAFWQNRFQKESTRAGTFHAPSADVPVSMMIGHDGLYAEGDGYQALALPYASTAVRMLFVLPAEGRFDELQARFDRPLIDEVRAALARPTDRDLNVSVPRFGFRAELDAGRALRALGMQAAFEPSQADFSGISQGAGLYLSDVLHQASIVIDEDGTEAAAATAILASTGTGPPPIVVVLDRPFLFLVYDEPTGQILFLGRLVDPRAN